MYQHGGGGKLFCSHTAYMTFALPQRLDMACDLSWQHAVLQYLASLPRSSRHTIHRLTAPVITSAAPRSAYQVVGIADHILLPGAAAPGLPLLMSDQAFARRIPPSDVLTSCDASTATYCCQVPLPQGCPITRSPSFRSVFVSGPMVSTTPTPAGMCRRLFLAHLSGSASALWNVPCRTMPGP